jgi:uracil-DNA glycosylase family 4
MEPQGEQAQYDLRDWDGDQRFGPPDWYDDGMATVDGEERPASPPRVGKLRRLDAIYDEIEADPFWDYLRLPGIRLVRGDGPLDAKIMIVGEAPGAVENGAGKPFMGVSGRLLDQLIDMMAGRQGFRSRCFLTNVVKYRPAGNSTPNIAAVLHAQEGLRKEWALVRPRLTIAVGATAHSAIHPQGGAMSLSQARSASGPWRYRNVRDDSPERYCISIYHPAYALHTKDPKQRHKIMNLIERDWDSLGDWLRENYPDVLE